MRQLDGNSGCFTGSGGSGLGGTRTVCGGIDFDRNDQVWRFNSVVTAQGNVTLTTR